MRSVVGLLGEIKGRAGGLLRISQITSSNSPSGAGPVTVTSASR